MFRRFLLWISHLRNLLCEFIMPFIHNQTLCTSASKPNAIASTSNSQTQLTPTRWDVFLSFHGEDTRLNFTGHLYQRLEDHGITTFKDDPALRRGEVISDALLDAIRKSKTYIVVLSPNYASSSWCLDELTEILNCYRTMQRSVIPVFCYVDPAVVRYQTGSFKKAFKKHRVRFVGERQKVNDWQLTLEEVAGISGHHLPENRSEAHVINEILDDLLLKINPKTLEVAEYPIGLDSRVEAITTLLSSDTKGVIKFGIYGMGGVGKTTLAKALYNQLLAGRSFKGSCFLADVREISRTTKGLVSLQQQLINDVLISTKRVEVHNADQGIKLIEARICSIKVVVVIDDLDDLKHFQSLVGPLASESVVIITTRDEEILDKIEVETRYRYMVNTLDDAESLELFTRHAFGNAKPNDTLMELSKDVLCLAGGLPLALKVFGSQLYKASEVGWKSYIEKQHRIPNSSIQKRLVISLEALESDDPILMKIFLDIACCFIGWGKQHVVQIIESYYSYADHYIDMLKKRCLLTINSCHRLGMHDLLQDVGREIAQNKCPDEPGKHSRLWVTEDICDVLKNHKGTEAIECISFGKKEFAHEEVAYTTETFKRMSKLRFLHLKKVTLTGSFDRTLDNLRWLRWDQCPLECLPLEFHPQNLVVLELRYSNMRTMWKLNMVPHVFGKLKTLDMSYSRDLITTPDFINLPSLETLNLEGCKSLEEVHILIGSLERLDSVCLQGCEKLRSLPDTICNLRALEVLTISQCTSLEALPSQLGNIKSLTKLIAAGLTVSKVPDSIGHLSKLVELDLSNNRNLETLPDTICNLTSLESLDVNSCSNLKELPIAIGNIVSLQYLTLRGLTVPELPDSIGRLAKLVELDTRYNEKLENLPDTICNLRSLKSLTIYGCGKLETLPDQMWKIAKLRMLNATLTTQSSQTASSLQELNLSDKGSSALPSGSSQLSNLQLQNDMIVQHELERIIWLQIQETLQNLYKLKRLEILHLSSCSDFRYIQGLEELTALRNSFLSENFVWEVLTLLRHISILQTDCFRCILDFGIRLALTLGNVSGPVKLLNHCIRQVNLSAQSQLLMHRFCQM